MKERKSESVLMWSRVWNVGAGRVFVKYRSLAGVEDYFSKVICERCGKRFANSVCVCVEDVKRSRRERIELPGKANCAVRRVMLTATRLMISLIH